MVKILMENSVTISIDINTNDYGGKTAFIIACQRGHADIAKFLMANSATMSSDFNAKAYDGKPAFIWCYEKGHAYVVDAVTSSGILKAKQKLGTYNFQFR